MSGETLKPTSKGWGIEGETCCYHAAYKTEEKNENRLVKYNRCRTAVTCKQQSRLSSKKRKQKPQRNMQKQQKRKKQH